MPNPRDACRQRLWALIEFARHEGWEVHWIGDRLIFVKAGLPPIFTPSALNARALLQPPSEPPLSEERNA
ncbi:MAG: type II toxin-antitoxin system HicA family toxin [Candidatus Accumulibacter sp.]|jgi:hypothetical protein|nr:type II toxin-antitoxin system HicA family toxin [Accumulibacter sp.]